MPNIFIQHSLNPLCKLLLAAIDWNGKCELMISNESSNNKYDDNNHDDDEKCNKNGQIQMTYRCWYSSGYGMIYPSGLGRAVLPTQKNASGPVPSYAKPLMNNVESSTA